MPKIACGHVKWQAQEFNWTEGVEHGEKTSADQKRVTSFSEVATRMQGGFLQAVALIPPEAD